MSPCTFVTAANFPAMLIELARVAAAADDDDDAGVVECWSHVPVPVPVPGADTIHTVCEIRPRSCLYVAWHACGNDNVDQT